MTDLDVLEGLAKAVIDTRKAYHLGEDGPNGLDLSFAYDDAVTAFQKASLPHEETILALISAARERNAMREALADAVGRFVEALAVESAIAERVEAGQQFNAYGLTDGDGAKALCLGPITSRPVSLCEAPASVADLLECALRVAMKARQALNQEQPA